MRVLALDLSLTASGWARTAELSWEVGTIRPRTMGTARLQEVLDRVAELSRGREVVVIEGYSYGSKAMQTHAYSLGELGGVIRLFLHQKGIPAVVVAPAAVKKLATGKGNAGKELVLVEAVKRLGYDGSDNNQADALWLLQAALIHYGLPGALQLPKVHLEALGKVQWPEIRRAA